MDKAETIILQKQPLGEADELVMCFTKDQGKTLFRARGVRKARAKHAAALRQCNLTDIYFVEGRRGPIVTDTTLQESFASTRDSEYRLAAAQEVCKMLASIVPSAFPDLVLWWQLNEYLQTLERFEGNDEHARTAPTFFMFSFLRLHGTRMNVLTCSTCGEDIERTEPESDGDAYVSPEAGGIVHTTCAGEEGELVSISPVARGILRTWLSLSFLQMLQQEISKEVREEIKHIVDVFAAWHLGERAVVTDLS